jgi:alpha-ketoglutaric semialdehyde dehydrogenase
MDRHRRRRPLALALVATQAGGDADLPIFLCLPTGTMAAVWNGNAPDFARVICEEYAHVIRSIDPFRGDVIFETEPGDPNVAVRRAAAAFPEWSGSTLEERAAILRRFADVVEQDADALARLCVSEMGKVLREAQGEVEWTAVTARWYADNPPATERAGSANVRQRPLGVVATITPWNVPLVTPAWKWLPALMAGNTVVWKPSEFTSGTAVRLVELLRAAGLPEDVLVLVPGSGDVGRALCDDGRVTAVHFTGSTRTGRAIAQTVAARLGRFALELGGLNYVIVAADADLEHAANCIVDSAVAINGQKCTATRRVLVDQAVAPELGSHLRERIAGLVSGDPRDPNTQVGPLIRSVAADRARQAVVAAVDRGARIVARSTPVDDVDTFMPAMLVSDVRADDPLVREELFAPVVTIGTYQDISEALSELDRTTYGLTCAVHTMDRELAEAAADRIQTGIFAINRRGDAVDLEAPFSGRRDSGLGAPEGGMYAYSGVSALQAVYGS